MTPAPRNGHFSIQQYLASCVRQVEKGTPSTEDNKVVELHFMTVAVDVARAQAHGVNFLDFMANSRAIRPMGSSTDMFTSYTDIGGAVGDQWLGLQAMAAGEALGLWKVYTPADAGYEGGDANAIAGAGGVMIGPPRDEAAIGAWITAPSPADAFDGAHIA
jgi:hypothetical protein